MSYNYTKIKNTRWARTPPSGKYRLLWTDRTEERRGLYFLQDFDRAQLAIDAANELGFSLKKGNGIVHDSTGRTLTLNDGPSQMYFYSELVKTFVKEDVAEDSRRQFTTKHADAIKALQPERLPGWQEGDLMLVFWQDIVDATGAVALCC